MTTTHDDSFGDALLAQTKWLRALVRTLVQDTARVDDVCQSTLLEAWRYKPGHERSLRPWLARVARSISARLASREKERPARESFANSARRGEEPSTSELVMKVAWQQKIAATVMELDEPYRETILLRYWEELPPRGIAKRQNIPVETVRTRLKRSMALLRQRLDRDCESRKTWFTALAPFAMGEGLFFPLTTTVLMSKAISASALVLVTGLVIAYLVWPDSSRAVPSIPPTGGGEAQVAAGKSGAASSSTESGTRVKLTASLDPAADRPTDPVFAAALCGFKGRIVDGGGAPVADCGVRVLRLALDGLMGASRDFFQSAAAAGRLRAHEVRTDEAGRFLVKELRPRGMFVLMGGIGTGMRTTRLLERAPSPGEVLDLGDIRLCTGSVLTGTVVDAAGKPLPGVRVRAIDLPAAQFAALPLERFDPRGAILSRSKETMFSVLPIPSWVTQLFEYLPIPEDESDANGRFRLTGLAAGEYVVVGTKDDLLPAVKLGNQVEEQRERNIGRLCLRKGHELQGRVIDKEGRPVPGAEILAAVSSKLVPIDLASYLEPSDADGRFHAQGFSGTSVTVAARRGPEASWVIAKPQAIGEEVIVTLPGHHVLQVRIRSKAGMAIEELALELVPGPKDRVTSALRQLGAIEPLDLTERLRYPSTGLARISELEAGPYVLAVSCKGHAQEIQELTIGEDETTVEATFDLSPSSAFEVRVVTSSGAPVRNAELFAQPARSTLRDVPDLPRRCGPTDREGRLHIEGLSCEEVLFTANHPRFGLSTKIAKAGTGETVIVMNLPGGIRGRLTEEGKPADADKWTVMLLASPARQGSMLALTPQLASPDRQGRFAFDAVQAGDYVVTAQQAGSAIDSVGRLFEMLDSWERRMRKSKRVTVRAGAVSSLAIELSGPVERADSFERGAGTALVTGSLLVDGNPGTGLRLRLHSYMDQRFGDAVVGRDGSFTLGRMPAGRFILTVRTEATSKQRSILYRKEVEIIADQSKHLSMAFDTSSVSGHVVTEAGVPAAGAGIEMLRFSLENGGFLHFATKADAKGHFVIERVLPGKYKLRAKMAGATVLTSEDLPVSLSQGLRKSGIVLRLGPASTVHGKIDLEKLGIARHAHATLHLSRRNKVGSSTVVSMSVGSFSVSPAGDFELTGLARGTYDLRLEVERAGELPPLAFRVKRALVVDKEDLRDYRPVFERR